MDNNYKKKAIDHFIQQYGYSIIYNLPWDLIQLDIYDQIKFDLMHVEFAACGFSKEFISFFINQLHYSNYYVLRRRIKSAIGVDFENLSNFHAEQSEDMIKVAPLMFKGLISDKYMKLIVLNSQLISLFTCYIVDDHLVIHLCNKYNEFHEQYSTVFQALNTNKPNYHYREELVMQVESSKLPLIVQSTYIGEKTNKYFKNLLSKYCHISWSFSMACK